MRHYEDLEVGSTRSSPGTHAITEAEIIEIGRRWDPQPFHTDPEAAAASPFGGLVASTVHLFAIATSLGVTTDPIAAISSVGMTNFVNHSPARPDDTLRHSTTVIERRLSRSRPGVGIVTVRGLLTNQRDEAVFSFESTVLVRCRDADAG